MADIPGDEREIQDVDVLNTLEGGPAELPPGLMHSPAGVL